MNVNISVPGTFHAFHLGEQLAKRNALEKIYTTYPRFKLETSLSKQKIQPVRHPEVLHRLLSRIPVLGNELPSNRWKQILFDRSVARNLSEQSDSLFVGFSGSTFQSIRQANHLGQTTVVERCSSHIRTQATILNEEYRRYGYESGPVSTQYIEHEEAEYRVADFIITPSEFVYSSFIEQGLPEEKVICEPYAVDTDNYTPDNQVKKPATFLFAGRVGLRKGVQYLLEAWDSLELPNAELILAGGIEESGKQFVDEYEDDPSVTFLGWTDNIDQLYDKATAFVLPTLEEGSAYVTYEAMASGVPVITTSHSGWVGEDGRHGIEIPVRDVAALAEAMKLLYDDTTLRAKLGRRARDHIKDEYSWERYGERIYQRYDEMLDSPT